MFSSIIPLSFIFFQLAGNVFRDMRSSEIFGAAEKIFEFPHVPCCTRFAAQRRSLCHTGLPEKRCPRCGAQRSILGNLLICEQNTPFDVLLQKKIIERATDLLQGLLAHVGVL